MDKIKGFLPKHIQLLSQGEIVAKSLVDYLFRHPEVESLCSKEGIFKFYTTESTRDFNAKASTFFGRSVESRLLEL
jgi:glutamate racemase